ncbi:MAG TPA: hypothetical protein VET66_08660 [Steroidobacteraceae bacterium]|nr:hypothetical protein [Steroidobacteraceae bacterium]
MGLFPHPTSAAARGAPFRAAACALVILTAVPAGLRAAAPALSAASPPPPDYGEFVVTLALSASFELNAAVARATWVCSAKAAGKAAIDATVARIKSQAGQAARDAYDAALSSPAHYYGQQTSVDIPLNGGQYHGAQSISIKVGSADLIDRASGHLVAEPTVMIGCWLTLYDRAGAGAYAYQSSAYQSSPARAGAASDEFRRVAWAPYVLTSAPVPNAD